MQRELGHTGLADRTSWSPIITQVAASQPASKPWDLLLSQSVIHCPEKRGLAFSLVLVSISGGNIYAEIEGDEANTTERQVGDIT